MGEPSFFDPELARAFCEAAPDALLVVRSDGSVAFANARAEALFGYARAEFLGRPIDLLLPETRGELRVDRRADLGAPGARPTAEGMPMEARRRDGATIAVEVSLGPVAVRDERFVIGAVRDVSRRSAVEATRREAEERFRLSFDEAPIGMALVVASCA